MINGSEVDRTDYFYDVENRLLNTYKYLYRMIPYSQTYAYNGNGQRIRKSGYSFNEGDLSQYREIDTQYFYEGSTVLYTTSELNAGIYLRRFGECCICGRKA